MLDTSLPTQRLITQRIMHPFGAPEIAVHHMLALQAQDHASALWAVGLRSNSSKIVIEQAIAQRRIIRTWPMRGTLHFVTASDARWMTELMAPRVIRGARARRQQLELSDEVLHQAKDILVAALEGDKQLSRKTLCHLLGDKAITPEGQRGNHILSYWCMQGILCQAGGEAKDPLFALLNEWAPEAQSLSVDESLAQLAQRYFTGHGPATAHDLMWWSGLTMGEVKKGIAMADGLANFEHEGAVYYHGDLAEASKTDPSRTFLLPAFDEYLLGYRNRTHILLPEHATKVCPGNNGMFMPRIIFDVLVVGIWKRVIKKSGVAISLMPFATLGSAPIASLKRQAESYATFLQVSLLSFVVI